jgi:hypothetical protein
MKKQKEKYLLWWELYGKPSLWLGVVVFFMVLAFGVGRLSASVGRDEVRGGDTAVVFITATPSPTPTLIPSTHLSGAGELITVRANWRLKAIGVSYFDGNQLIERVYCDPLPHDQTCTFPRPPLLLAHTSSFTLMARDENAWHYFSADPTQSFHNIEWGIEGSLYRYFVSH